MPAFCSLLFPSYFSKNYSGKIGASLLIFMLYTSQMYWKLNMKHIYMYYNYVGVINVCCMYKYIQHTYKYICILDKCNMQTNKYVKHICIFSHIDCILLSKYTTYVSLKYIQTNTLFFPVQQCISCCGLYLPHLSKPSLEYGPGFGSWSRSCRLCN